MVKSWYELRNEFSKVFGKRDYKNKFNMEDIYIAIQEDMSCKISHEQAELIWDYAYDMGEYGGAVTIFSTLFELMNLVEGLLT